MKYAIGTVRVTEKPPHRVQVQTPHGWFNLSDQEGATTGQLVRVSYDFELGRVAQLVCWEDAEPIGEDGCCSNCGVAYGPDYCEACKRAGYHAAGCSKSDATPVSKVLVELEIRGKADDALHVVDALLDAGFFQDAINDHDADAGPLHVVTAVCRPGGAS